MIEQRGLSGLVTWMAGNPVAANLLMLALLLGGLLGFKDIRQEITPDFTLESVRVTMAYPGASPREVEESIILAVEKELTGMNGVSSLISSAGEGSGTVTAELDDDALRQNSISARRLGFGGKLLFLACTGAVFMAGAKILDCLKHEKRLQGQPGDAD